MGDRGLLEIVSGEVELDALRRTGGRQVSGHPHAAGDVSHLVRIERIYPYVGRPAAHPILVRIGDLAVIPKPGETLIVLECRRERQPMSATVARQEDLVMVGPPAVDRGRYDRAGVGRI